MFYLPQDAAVLFFALTAPICAWVAYTDLARMKILNIAVGALLAVYVLTAHFVLPLDQYLWGFAHFGVVLGIGFMLNIGGALGAGDAKFMAAAAPFVPLPDMLGVVTLFAAVLLAAFVTHRACRAVPLVRRATPGWVSWERRKFPMGLALGPAFAGYLAAAAFTG